MFRLLYCTLFSLLLPSQLRFLFRETSSIAQKPPRGTFHSPADCPLPSCLKQFDLAILSFLSEPDNFLPHSRAKIFPFCGFSPFPVRILCFGFPPFPQSSIHFLLLALHFSLYPSLIPLAQNICSVPTYSKCGFYPFPQKLTLSVLKIIPSDFG